jgi:diguanylate cyclase (GGDEF)-like protein
MVDLDNFKRVNDRFGHHIGDKVLQATAQILQSTLRRVDITVRNGGEEFVLMLPGADLPAALIACERVRAAIEAYDWSIIASELQMTASIGLCHSGETESRVSGITGHDLVPLLALADERLYQAKALGKNRIVVSQSREAVAPQFPAHRRPI